jgi:uncharacterized protein
MRARLSLAIRSRWAEVSAALALPVWMKSDGNRIVLSMHVQPGAKSTQVVGVHGEALKIRLHASPVDGKANAALCKFIAHTCGAVLANIEIISGQMQRQKRVAIRGGDAAKIVAALRGDAIEI